MPDRVPLERLSKPALLAYIYKDEARIAATQYELDKRTDLAKRGQLLAFCSLLTSLAAAVWLGLAGHDWLAGVVAGGSMVTVIGLFITGRYQKATPPELDPKDSQPGVIDTSSAADDSAADESTGLRPNK